MTRDSPSTLRVAVALGGAIGAVGRVAVDAWLPMSGATSFPLGTLIVNLSGVLVLAALTQSQASPRTRAFVGTGMLGAWTTFSALAVQTSGLIADAPLVAAAYVAATLVGGIVALRIGHEIGPASAAPSEQDTA